MTNTAVAPHYATTAATNASGKQANAVAANAANAAGTSNTGGSASASSASNSTNQQSVNNGLAALAGNFQSFLTLLTAQLKNQDPLNPTDTNQFTQQITQMSGVEQQLLSNQLLQQLVSAQGGVTAAANLIGDKITATEASTTSSVGTQTISGTVTAVSQINGQTMLTVGSVQVPLTAVTSVTQNNASNLASLLGG
jgi:flagellar basal-body rod modification protein FlgD